MPDPAVLRAQAQQLRTAATTMRSQADALDDDVVGVEVHYPARSTSIWKGPYADRYFGALATAKTQISNVATQVHEYADACDKKATSFDHQADELAAQQATSTAR